MSTNTNPNRQSNVINPQSSSNQSSKHQASPEESAAKRIRKNRTSSDESDIDLPNTSDSHALHSSNPSFTANPTFFILEALDGSSLARLSPFAIEKAIQGSLGTVNQVKKLRNGKLLVEISRPSQATNIRKITNLASIPVSISEHRSLNSCKGTIRSFELAAISPAELQEELRPQGIIDIKYLYTVRDGTKKSNGTMILTFNNSTLPKHIKAGYYNINVRQYIPNPMRCFKCQRYGHHQSTCNREEICSSCGLPAHTGSQCQRSPHCVNCGEGHTSNFNRCPHWLKEKEICKIKLENNISYPEARRRVENRNPNPSQLSFAQVIQGKPKMISIATQTDVTKCMCEPNFKDESQDNLIKTRDQGTDTSDLNPTDHSTERTRRASVSPHVSEGGGCAGFPRS